MKRLDAFLCLLALNIFNFNCTSGHRLKKFWTSTGFSPPDSAKRNTSEYLLSRDEFINLGLVSFLPNNAITHVRAHWLLELIAIRSTGVYDWNDMDAFLDSIVQLGLKPRIELMGSPKQSTLGIFDWQHLCFSVARHFIDRYGENELDGWIFETWNEPDLKMYNTLNFTAASYLQYVDQCSSGLKLASKSIYIGGPAGLFKSKHVLCWEFINFCNNFPNRCQMDYISFHKKGDPLSVTNESVHFIKFIRRNYPNLSNLSFVNSESDLLSGWWRLEEWRGDVRYAAEIVRMIALYASNKEYYLSVSIDNGFMNDFRAYFNQRTLLTRFARTGETSDFIKKPIYSAMAILGYLLDFLNSKIQIGSQHVFIDSRDGHVENNTATASVIAFSDGNKTSLPPQTISFSTSYTIRGKIRYVVHCLNNSLPHPQKIWQEAGNPERPSQTVIAKMRLNEEPHKILEGIGEQRVQFTLSAVSPTVCLIRTCLEHASRPGQVSKLRAIRTRTNEVLLGWKDDTVSTRCISTYVIEYCPRAPYLDDCFTRINKQDSIFCSFYYSKSTVTGMYRVYSVDLWNRSGPAALISVM